MAAKHITIPPTVPSAQHRFSEEVSSFTRLFNHFFYYCNRYQFKIERVVQNHLKYDREELNDLWELFSSEGEMKMYRREIEENGLVVDPLKAVHVVKVII